MTRCPLPPQEKAELAMKGEYAPGRPMVLAEASGASAVARRAFG